MAVAAALLLASLIGACRAFSVPGEEEETRSLLEYRLEASFDHQAYGPQVLKTDTPNPTYFARLIDSIDLQYTYEFVSDQLVGEVSSEGEIVALVSSRDLWEKELYLTPLESDGEGGLWTNFKLDTSRFFDLAAQISQAIGIGTAVPEVKLLARVRTVVQTENGVLDKAFIHPLGVQINRATLQWERGLSHFERGYFEGMEYQQEGNYGYTIRLKPNIVYEEPVIQSGNAYFAAPEPLPMGASYPVGDVDAIDGTLSLKLTGDGPVTQAVYQVEVNAVLQVPGRTETFALVAPRQLEENDTVTFPLDIVRMYSLIREAEQAAGAAPATRALTITAQVSASAGSEFGPVNDTLVHRLPLRLTPNEVQWPDVKPLSRTGSITETRTVPNPDASNFRVISTSSVVIMVIVFAFAFRSHIRAQRDRPTALELEAFNAKRKFGELLVDVQTVPDVTGTGTLVQLGSVGELFKAAEAVLKPVLHKAEPHRHLYFVLDGNTMYQYLNESETAVEEELSEEELRQLAEIYGVSLSYLAGEAETNAGASSDRAGRTARELAGLDDDELERILDVIRSIKRETGRSS